jgi:hypothetical protein
VKNKLKTKNHLAALALAALIPVTALASVRSAKDPGRTLYDFARFMGRNPFGTGGLEGWFLGASRIRLGLEDEAVPDVTYNLQDEWDGLKASHVKSVWLNFAFVRDVEIKAGPFRVPVGAVRTQFSGNDQQPFLLRRGNGRYERSADHGWRRHDQRLRQVSTRRPGGLHDGSSAGYGTF